MNHSFEIFCYHTILLVVLVGITALTLYAGTLDRRTGDLIADNRQCADGGAAAGEQAADGNEITERILPPMTGAGSAERGD